MQFINNNVYLGSHIPFQGSLTNTIRFALKNSMNTLQFFLGSPKSYSLYNVTDDDLSEAVNLCEHFDIPVFSHAKYLYNLAGSKKSLAWNGDPDQDRKTQHIIQLLETELGVLSNFKRNGVIVHPGNYTDRSSGLKAISESISKINFPENSKLLLENSAGQGTSLATTLQEIQTIISGVDESKHKYLGVCIDTAHLHGYGEYDVSKISEIDRLFRDFDETIGKERLSLIHFNDACVKFGSRKDRHFCILQGEIFKNTDVVRYFIKKCEEWNVPMVLETVPEDIHVLREIYK
jgi:deoxyribonuclease-4